MTTFDTSHVRNIALLGHAGTGKTTLAECMLFEAGVIDRPGSIREGNTVGDHHPLERERGHTFFSKLMHADWKGYKINIIDTPGFDDFNGEVISALRVADTGIMLIDAAAGVEVGADLIWDYTERFKTPMILAINKMDLEDADFDRTLMEARQHFGNKVVPVQFPINSGSGFSAVVDLLRMTVYEYPQGGGKPEKKPIPEALRRQAEKWHRELVEAVAVNDETLMEHYLERGALDEDEMREGLKRSLAAHDIFPVFCMSAGEDKGAGRLMSFVDNVCPSAREMPPQQTLSGESLPCDASGPACIFVFKTIAEPHVGELSLFKVYSGSIRTGMELVNESNGVTEKISQLFVMEGNKRIPVDELVAGDIGATLKLRNTHVNNTLHVKGRSLELAPIDFPEPNLTVAIEPASRGDEDKLSQALHTLVQEDPTLKVEVSAELKQTLLRCQGEMHLAVIKWKLEHVHRVEVQFKKQGIPYRETLRSAAVSSWRHKKQSGGAGQFAEVHMRVEAWHEGIDDPEGLNVRGREEHPLDWGGKLIFLNCIVGGAIDARFLPSIMKGVMEKMQEGPLTGAYVRDVRVSVFDGKMHPVDSNDISFKVAGKMAFREAFRAADPQLLEPVWTLEVLCPDELTGHVMGDLQTRRAMIEGIETDGHFQRITARVPLAETEGYPSALRSLTQGRARLRMNFSGYAPVPYELQQRLMDAYHKVSDLVEA